MSLLILRFDRGTGCINIVSGFDVEVGTSISLFTCAIANLNTIEIAEKRSNLTPDTISLQVQHIQSGGFSTGLREARAAENLYCVAGGFKNGLLR
jgi:hypothetical protein